MMGTAKLVSIHRGEMSCDHCGRFIKILCTIEQDGGQRKTVGSTCVEKFVPELVGVLNHKLRIFNAAERRQKKQLARQQWANQKQKEFEAKLMGSSVKGAFLVRIVEADPDFIDGITKILTDSGFEVTEDETILAAPSLDEQNKALELYEGLSPVEAQDVEFVEAVEAIRQYKGRFEFFLSLQNQLFTKGYLSDAQVNAVKKCLAKQKSFETEAKVLSDASVTVKQWFAKYVILNQTGLNVAHYNFDVLKLFRETDKALEVEMRATGKPTKHCSICGILLTNEESVLRGIGPICAENVGVSDASSYNAKLQEVAVTFRTWLPKKAIKEAIGFSFKPVVEVEEVAS